MRQAANGAIRIFLLCWFVVRVVPRLISPVGPVGPVGVWVEAGRLLAEL